jgi:TATA-binding protein-associated factor Taf7
MENINLDKIIKSDELDYNMILSVPEHIGSKLQKIIQGLATRQEKESTQIEIIENPTEIMEMDENRKMLFKINDTILPITILDLPCTIEANKTIDFKTLYKASDIGQMMYVHDENFKLAREEDIIHFEPFKAGDENFNKLVWKKDYDHKFKARHGLAKCTKNIRARRFKRKIKYNHDEILEVAKKLKSIIDNGAINFEKEMKNKESIVEDENLTIKNTMENQSIARSVSEADKMIGKKSKRHNESSNKKRSNKATAQKEFNAPETVQGKKLNLNIVLPLSNQNSLVGDININKNSNNNLPLPIKNIPSKEEQDIYEEYNRLREEYKIVKDELDKTENKDEGKVRHKKKLKKRIKQLKEMFKQIAAKK